jgi:predicted  nucleic acid-binding Zn-ribbon protein
MTRLTHECECGHSFVVNEEERVSTNCPKCGRSPRSAPEREEGVKKSLSDSAIEATFEVMAEEGAVWSGAR